MTDVCTDENSMISRSLAGEPEAFGGIVAKYQSQVCSVAYSATGDLALSEDLAQEAFLIAWQKMNELRDRGKLGAWLCGIVRNIARDAMRRKQRDLTHHAEPLDESVATAERADLAERITQAEREAVMWAALEGIPETYREPLILFYREGKSIRNVAEALDLTEDCVKQRLARGRAKLKAEMAAFVEETLGRTLPGKRFTAAVIGALTAAGAKQAAAVSTAASVGTGMAAWSLGGMLGMVSGIAGGLYGARKDYQRAQSGKERRLVVIFTAAVFVYIAIWLLTFPLIDQLAGLRVPEHVRLLVAWLGAGIGGLGAIVGIGMSRLNRARLEAQGIDSKALRDLPLLVEEDWKVSSSALSFRRAILGVALGLSALAVFIFVWIAVEYSLFASASLTTMMALAVISLAGGITAALWLGTNSRMTVQGRRFYSVWILVLAALVAAHLAVGLVLPSGMWTRVEQNAYMIVLIALTWYGIVRSQKLEKSGMLYERAEMPKFVPGVPVRLSRANALLQVYGMFVGATCWMVVMAALVRDWSTVVALAAAIVAVPATTLKLFGPRYWRIVLADMAVAAFLSLSVITLRWNAWMAQYRVSRFYEPINDQPRWVMSLLLGALFAVIIMACAFKDRRDRRPIEMTDEKETEQ